MKLKELKRMPVFSALHLFNLLDIIFSYQTAALSSLSHFCGSLKQRFARAREVFPLIAAIALSLSRIILRVKKVTMLLVRSFSYLSLRQTY